MPLLRWTLEARLISSEHNQRLLRQSREDTAQSQQVLQHARELREVIYRVFTCIIRHETPAPDDLADLQKARQQAVQHQIIEAKQDEFWFGWPETPDLNLCWWPVVLDAAELLVSDVHSRVGQCADDRGCGWLFLDTSKAGRRKWCSMEDCGNRAKVRRHRHTQENPGT